MPVELFLISYYGAFAISALLVDADLSKVDGWMELDTVRGRALATVKLAVFLDMIGVGIFVPMLSFYWKELGVRTSLMGLVGSTYNMSQIVSGIVLGYVSDHILGRKNVLLLSFAGSAVSYALAGMAFQGSCIWALVLSRVVVGLVKQTMTISRAITVSLEPDDLKRTTALSHLRAVTTLAFMIGPTIGGLLSKYFNRAVPAYAAATLFVFNFVAVSGMLPSDVDSLVKDSASASPEGSTETETSYPASVKDMKPRARGKSPNRRSTSGVAEAGGEGQGGGKKQTGEHGQLKKRKREHLQETWEQIRTQTIHLLTSSFLGPLTLIKILNQIFVSALYTFAAKYVVEKYALEPHHMGYLSSYQSIVSLVSQTYLGILRMCLCVCCPDVLPSCRVCGIRMCICVKVFRGVAIFFDRRIC